MIDHVRAALQPLLGDDNDWSQLQGAVTIETVTPGTCIRATGDAVHDLLVVARGLLEVDTPGEPPQWAPAGAIVGGAESVSGAPSTNSVTAIRHTRVMRVSAKALWDPGAGVLTARALTHLARATQSRGDELSTLPPDPLVITIVLEGIDAEHERQIAMEVETAVATLDRARLVHITDASSDPATDLADELASYEVEACTLVFFVGAGAGERGAAVTAHADRVLLLQPLFTTGTPSAARNVACDGSARRHTEVVYVAGGQQSTSDATQRMRTPAHTKRVHLLPEHTATRFALLLAELRQAAREHEALREFEVFADVAPRELAWVQRKLRWERVDGGSFLVQQGQVAGSLCFLRAGRLEVVRETQAGERHLAWLGPGSVVGEAAILAGTAHTESVRAVRDSAVARLDRETVSTLMERSVGFAGAMARVVAREFTSRTYGELDPGVRRGRTIAVVPLAAPARVRAFVAQLTGALEREGCHATIVDTERLDAELGAGTSRIRRGDVGDSDIIAWLDRLERQHETVILLCGAEVDSWTRRAHRQSDAVLFVADALDDPSVRPVEMALLGASLGATWSHETQDGEVPSAFVSERHLVLLQPAGITQATGTGAWLAERSEHKHHHVRADSREDLDRLARRVTARSVALALSGAASRAPAHFGVVRAMQQLGLPIDIMSGSSSGAGVAALLAMGLPYEQALSHALTIITKGIPTLRQFQPPITALTSGQEAGEALQAAFGDRQLEDQLIPVVITAVDIRRHRLVLLTRGPIWKLVRASGSLPLLWPPVWHEDDLLVDGAILSYLPVEVFGGEVEAGLVIGSNLKMAGSPGAPAFERSLRYGTTMSGWRSIGQRLRARLLGAKVPRPPGLVEILYHAMAIPSFEQLERLALSAGRDNLCIVAPPIGNYGLFGADAEVGKRLERESSEYALGALADVAAKWKRTRGQD
ncbi:MAG: cyclic nucleotide-binding domain-containing protein [Gemmatimonadaceae bacterium]|nr:cyclic nucleotide-binding domain-containing protein [Gemmatimonadaceae bacterium]